MPFDFDVKLDRRHSDSGKWNVYPEDVIPMSVADMDFLSPPAVSEALKKRAEHGTFGYGMRDGSAELRSAIQAWAKERYHFAFETDQIQFVPNLVSPLFAWARVFGEAGDGALGILPNYPPFTMAIASAGKALDRVDLVPTEANGILRYEIDFEALEKAITPRTKVALLCNPLNPLGRVLTRKELETLAEILLKHNLYIVSDEIHADLILDVDAQHTPIASLSPEVAQRTVTLNAPSKTFNIPGLGLGYMVVQNKELLDRYQKAIGYMVPHAGLLGMIGATAAYTQGTEWLAELLVYLRGNRDYLVDFIRRELPQIKLTSPEGTYLAWLDCRALNLEPSPFEFFLTHGKVALGEGKNFGSGYEGFIRLNFGCPRTQLEQALTRMKTALEAQPSGVA